MKIILTENIASLGEIGQIVNVAPGYARNYLLPQGLALKATGENVRELEHRKRILAAKREKVRREMLSAAEKLNQVSIQLHRKVAEDDKLYGSVSVVDIANALEGQGFEVDRKNIILDQPIKQLGTYSVPIRMGSDVNANIQLVIEKEE
ncbi:50S ribosomal protein L9 [Desulfoferrobacter suflitae]|uniref:50S ribosomal protein L9 n=1 Tax=Desulfoferrobacter suflitae TaxID=2865782 RepID=UPI002164E85C|nr:50S ribosomal protein L9 [Desulfoferrobacter suflitae]MCK8600617.1 50S ribosomal protein L9 [Desulfoferrobacter suflitae]